MHIPNCPLLDCCTNTRISSQVSAMDSRAAIAGVCSWIVEARILVLHALGFADADYVTLPTEWCTLSKRKQNDEDFGKKFDSVIGEFFDLKPDEWRKVSYDFYHKQQLGIVYERPPAEEVLDHHLALLPQPFNSEEYKDIFTKLIQRVAERVQIAEQVCT